MVERDLTIKSIMLPNFNLSKLLTAPLNSSFVAELADGYSRLTTMETCEPSKTKKNCIHNDDAGLFTIKYILTEFSLRHTCFGEKCMPFLICIN